MRLRVDGKIYDIDALPKLSKNVKHTTDVVVDRLKVRPELKQRLAESFETALRHADGRAIAVETDSGKEHLFSAKFACPACSYSLAELEPRLFSFNNPLGACPECDGLGAIEFFDPRRVVAHPHLCLASGAIKGWDRRNQFYFQMLTSLAAHFGFDVEAAFDTAAANGAGHRALRQQGKDRLLLPERTRPHRRARARLRGRDPEPRRAATARPIPSWCARNWRNT